MASFIRRSTVLLQASFAWNLPSPRTFSRSLGGCFNDSAQLPFVHFVSLPLHYCSCRHRSAWPLRPNRRSSFPDQRIALCRLAFLCMTTPAHGLVPVRVRRRRRSNAIAVLKRAARREPSAGRFLFNRTSPGTVPSRMQKPALRRNAGSESAVLNAAYDYSAACGRVGPLPGCHPQHVIEDDRAERRGTDAVEREAATLSLKLPAPSTSATATVMRLRGFEKSTRFSTQIRARGRGDQAEHHDRQAAEHRPGNGRRCSAPNFGEKPSRIANAGRDDEDQRRIDPRDRHHAHVLGIGGHAGAAGRAGHHGGDAVAHEGAAEIGIEVAARSSRRWP